jgi:hypothetical protein
MITPDDRQFNLLNAELNPICHLLALLGAHHILHISKIRVKDNNCALLGYYAASGGNFLSTFRKTYQRGCPETSVGNCRCTPHNNPEEPLRGGSLELRRNCKVQKRRENDESLLNQFFWGSKT